MPFNYAKEGRALLKPAATKKCLDARIFNVNQTVPNCTNKIIYLIL